eukprot:1863741-Alexandrium_andersonii.AAC.1
MQSHAVPKRATATLEMTPTAMMKLSLLEAFVRGPPWQSSGQRGSECATSAPRTCCGAKLA